MPALLFGQDDGAFGRTAHGYRRFRCRECGRGFNGGDRLGVRTGSKAANRRGFPGRLLEAALQAQPRHLAEMFLIRGIVFTPEAVRDGKPGWCRGSRMPRASGAGGRPAAAGMLTRPTSRSPASGNTCTGRSTATTWSTSTERDPRSGSCRGTLPLRRGGHRNHPGQGHHRPARQLPVLEEVFCDDLEHRTSKYLNNHLETQYHRGKRALPSDAGFPDPHQRLPLLPGPRRASPTSSDRRPGARSLCRGPSTGDPCPESCRPPRHARRRLIKTFSSGLIYASAQDLARDLTEPIGRWSAWPRRRACRAAPWWSLPTGSWATISGRLPPGWRLQLARAGLGEGRSFKRVARDVGLCQPRRPVTGALPQGTGTTPTPTGVEARPPGGGAGRDDSSWLSHPACR